MRLQTLVNSFHVYLALLIISRSDFLNGIFSFPKTSTSIFRTGPVNLHPAVLHRNALSVSSNGKLRVIEVRLLMSTEKSELDAGKG
jgi:hypothetical protein